MLSAKEAREITNKKQIVSQAIIEIEDAIRDAAEHSAEWIDLNDVRVNGTYFSKLPCIVRDTVHKELRNAGYEEANISRCDGWRW